METKEVSTEKFNALLKKNIELRNCPKCGNFGGQLIVDFPMYGRDGAYCKCYQCGFETKRRSMNITMFDKQNKRMGTPVIEKSLMSAIRNAINDWNGRSENET